MISRKPVGGRCFSVFFYRAWEGAAEEVPVSAAEAEAGVAGRPE